MNKNKRTKLKVIISIGIAFFCVGIYLVHNLSNTSAAVPDCATISGNLIQNCGFENENPLPVGVGNQNLSDSFGGHALQAGYTGLTSWNILSPVVNSNIDIFPAGANAAQGSRIIDISGVRDTVNNPAIDGERSGSGIEQTVSGLVIGKTYNLVFYQSVVSSGLFPSEITLVIDGVDQGIYSITPSTPGDIIGTMTWVKQTYSFVASNTSATITFRSDFDTVSRGIFAATSLIDNVSLVIDADPAITLSTPANSVNGSFNVTLTPSELIAGLTLNDLSISNGTASNLSGSGSGPYTFTVTPVSVGNITITLPASTVVDSVGNTNNSSNTLIVNYDPAQFFTNVHIESNNSNVSYATVNNVVTLSYTMESLTPVQKQSVIIGGISVIPVCIQSLPTNSQDCSAALIVTPTVPSTEGLVSFSIEDQTNNRSTTVTTDNSYVIVDRIPPVVTITSPTSGSTVTGVFNLTGTCESGLDVTITAGNPANYKPTTIIVPCVNGVYSATLTPTGDVGSIITIASIQQTDAAGNQSAPLGAIYTIGGTVSSQILTINGPIGVVSAGQNTVIGECQSGRNVTIIGTGFTPTPGTTNCVNGTYSYPITISGNTVITACQRQSVGVSGGEPVYSDVCVTTTTTLPTIVTNTGGSSGGCIYATGCNGVHLDFNNPSSTPVTNPVVALPVVSKSCPKFTQYLKKGNRDGVDGISEVSKIQDFLNRKLGKNITVDGSFGLATVNAVKEFQSIFFSNILSPWNLTSPTGWWYQSTRHYANLLEGCPEGITVLDNGVIIQDGNIVNK